MTEFAIPVSTFVQYINDRLGQDVLLRDLWIEGEVISANMNRGNCYFSLADETARVDCVCFRSNLAPLQDVIQNEKRILVRGRFNLYGPSGRASVIVDDAKLVGEGELARQKMLLQKRMEAKGYFAIERKRTLPPYPRRIAIVTSRTGAAREDIERIIRQNNPYVERFLVPTLVQGDAAPVSIARAIAAAGAIPNVDVVIVTRGGGSAADLSAFDDERVVEAVVHCPVPVISAVGHQRDWSFCDMAADERVSTPTAAASRAVPKTESILDKRDNIVHQIRSAVFHLLEGTRGRFRSAQLMLERAPVVLNIRQASNRLSATKMEAANLMRRRLQDLRARHRVAAARLESLNPSKVISAGYAVVLRDGRRVFRATDLHEGEHIELLFADGTVKAVISGDAVEEPFAVQKEQSPTPPQAVGHELHDVKGSPR